MTAHEEKFILEEWLILREQFKLSNNFSNVEDPEQRSGKAWYRHSLIITKMQLND